MYKGSENMWIYSYKIEKNLMAPEWVIDNLKIKYLELKEKLIEGYGDKHKIHMEFSMHSEACYLFVECKRSKRSYKISFRSHEYYDERESDYIVYLYKFRTWKKCEKWFFKRCMLMVFDEISERVIS